MDAIVFYPWTIEKTGNKHGLSRKNELSTKN